MSGNWICAACDRPVALAEARAHYDACTDEIEPYRCPVCAAETGEPDELCSGCQLVAPPTAFDKEN